MARRVKGAVVAAPEMAAQARELLAQGLSKRAIAARLRVSEATLYRCLRGEWAAEPRTSAPPPDSAHSAGERRDQEDDGYPEALVRRVPRDFTPILPRRHYLALLRAAKRAGTAAAIESRRQALLLHAEPMFPPPTSIELALSPAEEAELDVRRPERISVPALGESSGVPGAPRRAEGAV